MISRQTISNTYITGKGIEIGAHHNPFPVRPGVQVDYVDKRTKKQLIDGFPEIKNHGDIPETTFIEEGQTLSTLQSNYYDFLLSSHQLEHCPSPLTALKNHVRLVKSNGILFYAIPDHTNPIDKNRKISNIRCVRDDYYCFESNHAEYENRLIDHYHEYLTDVDRIYDESVRASIAKESLKNGQDIHFHCWNSDALLEMFIYASTIMNLSFYVELFYKKDHEYLILLRKI